MRSISRKIGLDIFDFNTQAAAKVLGTAVSERASQIFREIERTIRTYEREKQAERSQNYDGAELHLSLIHI